MTSVAIHEAGHAVAAFYAQIPVASVEITALPASVRCQAPKVSGRNTTSPLDTPPALADEPEAGPVSADPGGDDIDAVPARATAVNDEDNTTFNRLSSELNEPAAGVVQDNPPDNPEVLAGRSVSAASPPPGVPDEGQEAVRALLRRSPTPDLFLRFLAEVTRWENVQVHGIERQNAKPGAPPGLQPPPRAAPAGLTVRRLRLRLRRTQQHQPPAQPHRQQHSERVMVPGRRRVAVLSWGKGLNPRMDGRTRQNPGIRVEPETEPGAYPTRLPRRATSRRKAPPRDLHHSQTSR
ncbi:hypothetical protein AB0F05_36525 [Streptomyces microflavus]|uniref:hypothetical protein n=1 Tax=Streptomyces TaxID=1883 RepID=UPI001C5611B5|nr:hypothetical protein [Streptomyces sp. 09ZI22]MBW3359332.1 hypothetical protein [Streptomyces sp. 09ZI22]